MKKLIALLAVLGFVHSAHAADFSHSGEFRLQYQNDVDADFDKNAGTSSNQSWNQRFRFGTTFRAGEQFTGHLMLAHNARWGQNADQFPNTNDAHNVLTVNEAYGSWMMSDDMMLRFGRGSITVADGTVVSANEFQPVHKAFDGVMFSYDHELIRANLFGVTGASTGNNNEFARFYGVSLDYKALPHFLNMANLHVVQVRTDKSIAAPTTEGEDAMRFGITLAGDTAGVDYRATYAMHDGDKMETPTKTDIKGSMMDLELGYTLPQVMGLRISALYHADSGTSTGSSNKDEDYKPFHYDIHNNAGLMDVVRWGNLTYIKLGLEAQPSEDLSVGLAYYDFTSTEKGAGTTGSGYTVGDATKDDVGSEINVWVKKSYSNNFSIKARYGIFDPGDRIGANADKMTQYYVAGTMSF